MELLSCRVWSRNLSLMALISRFLRGQHAKAEVCDEHLQNGACNRRQVLNIDVHAGCGIQGRDDIPPPRKREPPRALDPEPITQPTSAELGTSDHSKHSHGARISLLTPTKQSKECNAT